MASNSQTKPGTRGKTCFLPRRDKPTTSLGGLTFSEHMELWQSERDAFTSVFDLEKREKGTDDEVEPCFGAQPRTGTQGAPTVFPDQIDQKTASPELKAVHHELNKQRGHVRDKAAGLFEHFSTKENQAKPEAKWKNFLKRVSLMKIACDDFRKVTRNEPLQPRQIDTQKSQKYLEENKNAESQYQTNWLNFHEQKMIRANLVERSQVNENRGVVSEHVDPAATVSEAPPPVNEDPGVDGEDVDMEAAPLEALRLFNENHGINGEEFNMAATLFKAPSPVNEDPGINGEEFNMAATLFEAPSPVNEDPGINGEDVDMTAACFKTPPLFNENPVITDEEIDMAIALWKAPPLLNDNPGINGEGFDMAAAPLINNDYSAFYPLGNQNPVPLLGISDVEMGENNTVAHQYASPAGSGNLSMNEMGPYHWPNLQQHVPHAGGYVEQQPPPNLMPQQQQPEQQIQQQQHMLQPQQSLEAVEWPNQQPQQSQQPLGLAFQHPPDLMQSLDYTQQQQYQYQPEQQIQYQPQQQIQQQQYMLQPQQSLEAVEWPNQQPQQGLAFQHPPDLMQSLDYTQQQQYQFQPEQQHQCHLQQQPALANFERYNINVAHPVNATNGLAL